MAQVAQVSQATVSYAYTRPEKISSALRDRVLRIADEIGYAGPNPGGQNLRTGHFGALGLMMTDSLALAFDDPATTYLLRGIAEVGELAEVALTLLPFPAADIARSADERDAHAARVALRSAVDGFLAYAMPDRHPALDAVRRRGAQMVVIDSPLLPGVPSVGIRDRRGAEQAARHLLELGHRRIGVLVDRLAPDGRRGVVPRGRFRRIRDRVARERIGGYRSAFAAHGLDFGRTTVVEAGGFNRALSLRAARTLLDEGGFTAVLASTDVLALAALDVLAERGARVPEDISVSGFDDLPAAATAGLTTVSQPLVEKGRRAADMLVEVMRGGVGKRLLLPTELVARDSTAPPR
ncbi:LacI family DNA-binding transcriptional regulator [Saccharopolyspora sp. CA-218241]|uniref:LacI family DNA-binding transcriptional regulator n=1 Tax=Saccharopolyspora sp. CA-218241 TaxID=3240027 RepID=UPI003D99AD70